MKRMARKNWKIYFLVLLAIAAVSLDLATSKKYKAETGTYRYESDFDAVTAATTKVAIVTSDNEELSDPVARTINPEYSQIEDMVRKAIELQGGLDWVISPGDMVMLKVNLVGGDSPSGQGENTDVRVVKALIKIIDELMVGDVEIVVAEGTARVNDVVGEEGSVWDNSGYHALLEDDYLSDINFSLFNLNQSYEDLVEVNVGNKATAAPHNGAYHVHKKELEADVYISVPVLKIHDTGLTNALKNQIGTAPGAYYGYNKMKGSAYYGGLVHDVDQRRWTTEEIVDLCAIADIDFVVVDAIMCLERYKTFQGNNQVRFNTILAGADPVAVDHVAAKMVGLNPDDIAHITLAAKIGLGTNNPENIELTGTPLEEAMKRVVKNDAPNGKFGQSNRTWLLSEYYNSTDIHESLIEGEADYLPVAGEEGWSEAVYFFDDRIDLLSFYQDAQDIISYAFTYFSSPQSQEAEIWLGTQEDMLIYLNGDKIYDFSGVNVFGDDVLYTKKITVPILEGVNSLLVKSLNEYGDYSFTLNICEPESNSNWEGNRVEGLRFFTSLADTGGQVVVDPLLETITSLQLWPNPTQGPIHTQFTIEGTENCKITVLDLTGQTVAILLNDRLTAGSHEYAWDLREISSWRWTPGIYICSFEIGNRRMSKKIILR